VSQAPAVTVSGTIARVVPSDANVPSPADLGAEGIRARAEQIDTVSYFEVLGVSDGAPAEAVRAAYMRLAKVWHPDRLPRELHPLRSEVARIFTHMTRAQQTLCDPTARQGYLATHAAKSGVATRPRSDVIRAVEQALARRDWDGAQVESLALCDATVDDAEAIALRAWTTACAGEAADDVLRTAMAKLDRAVNVDNTCVRAFFYRAKIAKRLGNEKAAHRDFSRTVALDPSNAEAAREVRVFEMRARKAR
jgi:curved DNA-binding protein CbpA